MNKDPAIGAGEREMMMKSNRHWIFSLFGLASCVVLPELAFASVESSMQALQGELLGTIMPLLSVLGLLFAGLAYLTGSPNARSYLSAAIIGAVIGFGAQSIVALIQSIVH
ncbi:MAG TPA: TrbC/VirB2 family protein [Bdellovibrio sp.]|nr:TrbC/VirB2 family protein [Bdellovibrio sp.]